MPAARRPGPTNRPAPAHASPVDAPPADPPPAVPPRPRWWSRGAWAAAHLLLGYHLLSLALGPARARPSSATQRTLFVGSEAYLTALNLNYAYQFFAPDPGPSTLLKYEGTRPDGTAVRGVIPDAAGHFPRLLYHRHFMLTERLGGPEGNYPPYRAALARGLGLQTGAEELELTILTHRLPEAREVRAGFGLDDPATYLERPLGRFDAGPLPAVEPSAGGATP